MDSSATFENLGVPIASPEDQPEVYAAFMRVARRLHLTQCQSVGLVPATEEVAIPPVALQLAVALARLGATPVTILDANTHRPAFASLAAAAARQEAAFTVTAVADGVTVTSPRQFPGRGVARGPAEQALTALRPHYAHILADLTGLERLGELLTTCELMDGVVIVARGRETREHELEDLYTQLPAARRLGALIVG